MNRKYKNASPVLARKEQNFSLWKKREKCAPKIRAPWRDYIFSSYAEKKAGQDTSNPAEDPCQEVTAMDWERWTIDEKDQGITEDLDDAVIDDHLVHPVLLLLHDDHHRPGVEGEGEEKIGKGKPEIEATRDLRMKLFFRSNPKSKIVQNGKLTWIQPVPATWIKTTYATMYHPYMFGSNWPGWQKLSELEKERDCLLQRLVLVQKKNGPFLVGKVGKEGTVECGLSVASI